MLNSPSKHLSREYLKMLRQNNYINKYGKEYAPCEVDELYWEKETRLANIEASKAWKDHHGPINDRRIKQKRFH